MDESPIRERQTEHINEIYDVDEDKDVYYGNEMDGKYYDRRQDTRSYYDPVIESKPTSTSLYAGIRPPSRTPSLSTKPPQKQDDTTTTTTHAGTAIPALSDIHPPSKSNDTKTPESVVAYLRKRAQETQTLLAEKHAALTELRKKHDIAMKRLDKLQSDLEIVSQKWESEERARIQSESTTALGKRKREQDDVPTTKRWKAFGLKGIEWGVLFGIGVASAMGVNKINQ
jgi:flagellin-like hook-associated protein FlgL